MTARPLTSALVAAWICTSSTAVGLPSPDATVPDSSIPTSRLEQRLTLLAEIPSPGIEAEISGILPVPDEPGHYYALVNNAPPYRAGQSPMIAARHRGALITIDRSGRILRSIPVAEDDFGGLAFANGRFYAALTNASEIVELDPATGRIGRRIPLPSPAGGLDYDPDRGALIAQLYVGHPQLLLIDPNSGRSTGSLWSEESAMGLIKVDGDWLCSWASGWEPGSFSEMRVIDQDTGHVLERTMLDRVHSAMGVHPDRQRFIVLVTVDQASGRTIIREYRYRNGRHS
jgi:hypothetical protein